jgi:hypothetical protein
VQASITHRLGGHCIAKAVHIAGLVAELMGKGGIRCGRAIGVVPWPVAMALPSRPVGVRLDGHSGPSRATTGLKW